MKKTVNKILSLGCLTLGMTLAASCTDGFENWNINPNEATQEEMEHDNLNTGSYFAQMQRGVFRIGKDMGGEYQLTQALEGDIFAQYFAPTMKWSNEDRNDQYNLYPQWYRAPFNDAYQEVMQPWYEIKKAVEANPSAKTALALATVVKVLAMQRVTDCYGPIPYSKFGTDIHVAYDSQQDVYDEMFKELADAIDQLTAYTESSTSRYMEDYDHVYQGNVTKWVKLANTLRLRMAMRISYVDEARARTEAAAAISNSIGLMTSSDDDAAVHQSSSLTFIHPLYEIATSWDDEHMSATMECYLKGLNDPRLKAYFLAATGTGEYKGIRNGKSSIQKSQYQTNTSRMNYNSDHDMEWVHAAEAYFLMAEAKLRFGLGSLPAKEYYEQGITTSFASAGVSGATSYYNNSESLPLAQYVDPYNNRSTDVSTMLTMLAPAWDDNASDDVNLQRIWLQKYLALYPDGEEAWAEMRRTGYPGIIPIESNRSNGEVPNGERISRLKFPDTEYTNNTENTNAAVQLLGGRDVAGTRLWWDVRRIY